MPTIADMRGFGGTCGLVVAGLAFTMTARAESEPGVAPRRGVYAGGALGFVYGASRVTDGYNTGKLSGPGGAIRGAFGFAPMDGFAIAAEVRGMLHGGYAWLEPSNDEAVNAPRFLVAGLLVDYYPAPLGPVHLELGLGAMKLGMAGEENASARYGGGPPTDAVSDLSGVFGHAGVGYTWRSDRGLGFGPVLDVYRTRATHGLASFDGYGFTFELALTSF